MTALNNTHRLVASLTAKFKHDESVPRLWCSETDQPLLDTSIVCCALPLLGCHACPTACACPHPICQQVVDNYLSSTYYSDARVPFKCRMTHRDYLAKHNGGVWFVFFLPFSEEYNRAHKAYRDAQLTGT